MEGNIAHPPRQFSANVTLINSLGKEWPGSCILCLPITDMQECSGPMAWVRIFFFYIMHGLSYFKHIWHKVSLQPLFFLMLKLFQIYPVGAPSNCLLCPYSVLSIWVFSCFLAQQNSSGSLPHSSCYRPITRLFSKEPCFLSEKNDI